MWKRLDNILLGFFVCFCEFWRHSIDIMFFFYCTNCIFYRPTQTYSLEETLCILNFSKKLILYDLYAIWNMGTWSNILINHLLLVILMSNPCHYTNVCPHKPHKHTHTHTHTHKLLSVPWIYNQGIISERWILQLTKSKYSREPCNKWKTNSPEHKCSQVNASYKENF